MHDPGASLWLLAAAACAFAGMGWLALAMPVHALQAWGGRWGSGFLLSHVPNPFLISFCIARNAQRQTHFKV